jgi:hypothetical protein
MRTCPNASAAHPSAIQVRVMEGIGNCRLLVSRHPESHWTVRQGSCQLYMWSLEMVQRRGGGIHMNRERVGEKRGGKEMDGYPLTAAVNDTTKPVPHLTLGSVRGHPSISLLPLSSPTLPWFICIPPPHLCTIFKDHT